MLEPNPIFTLKQITSGHILPRCLHVVADLGVADVLDETAQTCAELAALVGADPDALGRVMSLLSAHGVFESQGDKFCHSPASRLLRSNHPQSMRAFVRSFGLPIQWTAYDALEYSVRTGRPAIEKTIPQGEWAYFAEHSAESAIFNEAMADKARSQVAAIISAYNFSGFSVVGDIGGGLGHLLRSVLDSAPNAKGILFDLPHVLEKAKGLSSERLTLQAGNFFQDVLPVCDAYLLMEVIHDWGDEQAIAILKAIRQVAPSHTKLILIETLVPNNPGPHWSKVLDIHMLTMTAGRQRMLQQYIELFDSASFSFQRKIDTDADISIIEAILARAE